jgi:oxygen-independent coproporphyrinogen-3 oxidase
LAGIYIHIPFCKKACFYCDFHFDVSFKLKEDIVNGLQKELKLRQNFFAKTTEIQSIYFGGGTPSVLNASELETILTTVRQHYVVAQDAEITLEANPDNLSLSYLQELLGLGVNRLSIGIQSFTEEHLQWMNRSHTAAQSLQCVLDAANVGFKDITIDLIYGLPQLNNSIWQEALDQALDLPINHLSAYSLTLESNTPYQKLVAQKKYLKPDDDNASEQFEILLAAIQKNGWDHYEVSNFCKTGNYSKHNTGYWQNKKYLGIGPSAHSYDGVHRMWNVASNTEYLQSLADQTYAPTTEILSHNDQVNEYILTGLRTKWGINLNILKTDFLYDIETRFATEIQEWAANNWVTVSSNNLALTSSGFLFADHIASELFWLT